jgi:hypothetical protein
MGEAYKWLQTLPPNIRDELKSMEQVVSVYLKAKRLGGGLPTAEDLEMLKTSSGNLAAAPVEVQKSSQEFQKTLKNLKTELDRFDNEAAQAVAQPRQIELESAAGPLGPSTNGAAPSPANLMAALRMDPRSRQIVNDIREGLNLGSDIEVIRMSLVLAHKTLRDLLK